VFFTDGLIEYKRDLQTAEERLARAVSSRAFLSAQNPAQAIVDSVLDGPQRDDIAVLVLLIRDEERGNAKENGL
jgi:serine phosphatase RsbU (regulator of sigma subunit)